MEITDLAETSISGLVLDQDALRYAYAAYKRGFLPDLEPDLNPEAFTTQVTAGVSRALTMGGNILVMRARTSHGEIPVGLIGIQGTRTVEPELIWFPEASLRNRIECLLKLLFDLRGERVSLFWSRAPDLPYFQHVSKYGSLRAVGKVHGYYEDGDATLFQAVNS